MRTKKILWPAAGVVAVLLAGAGIAIATRGGSDKPATTAAPGPVVSSAATVPTSPPPPPGADITGPLNLLLVGVDTRVSIPDWQPHADTVMLLHVDEGLERGYLYSLPRDLRVDVPAYAKNGYGGGRHKLTEAMSYGSEIIGTDKANVSNGYELLSRAVTKYTGIKLDAGAVLTFNGLSKLTDALGGVTMTIDQKVLSQHRKPDGTARPLAPGGGGYLGPQAAYLPGTRTLTGWQAIDYARQRYGLPNGDYDRQRHQRQLVKALVTKAQSSGLATDQAKLRSVLGALGDTLVFSGERTPLEYAYALRDLTPAGLTSVSLPGDSVFSGGGYIGEQLTPTGRAFLKAVAGGNPGPYLAKHPELRSK